MRSSIKTIIEALRILANDIKSEDGVANACILEAANRLDELRISEIRLEELLDSERAAQDMLLERLGKMQERMIDLEHGKFGSNKREFTLPYINTKQHDGS